MQRFTKLQGKFQLKGKITIKSLIICTLTIKKAYKALTQKYYNMLDILDLKV